MNHIIGFKSIVSCGFGKIKINPFESFSSDFKRIKRDVFSLTSAWKNEIHVRPLRWWFVLQAFCPIINHVCVFRLFINQTTDMFTERMPLERLGRNLIIIAITLTISILIVWIWMAAHVWCMRKISLSLSHVGLKPPRVQTQKWKIHTNCSRQ